MKKKTFFLIPLLFTLTSIFAQTVSTYSGGTPDDAIAIDTNGNIYTSNFTGDKIFKFDNNGNATAFITGLDTPNGIAFDTDENLFVCDWNANFIYKYDLLGSLLNSYQAQGNPSGMIRAFDGSSMIFTEYTGNKINRLAADGSITQISSASELDGPVGLAYDEAGTLYVGNYNNREVYKVLSNGDLQYIATVGDVSNLGFITYAQGMLWGTVLGEHKIYKIDPEQIGAVEIFAGSVAGIANGDLSDATFSQPNGIIFNATQEVMYVTDFGSKNLRIISNIILSNNDQPLKKNSFQISPNPATASFKLRYALSNGGQFSINIYDIMGTLVWSKTENLLAGSREQIFSTHQWSSGVYFLEISGEGLSITKKLIKQ